jgi:hypothetical protein
VREKVLVDGQKTNILLVRVELHRGAVIAVKHRFTAKTIRRCPSQMTRSSGPPRNNTAVPQIGPFLGQFVVCMSKLIFLGWPQAIFNNLSLFHHT